MCDELDTLDLEDEGCMGCENKQLAMDMLEMFIDNGIVQFNIGNNAANVEECLTHYTKIFTTLNDCKCSVCE